MTSFKRENFDYFGGYLNYRTVTDYSVAPTFIARFKYASVSSKGTWITFMIKNFTVEEYVERMDNGESPLAIMQSKGFIHSHVKKILKKAGYPQTLAGQDQMIDDQIAARHAAEAA